MRGQYFTSIKPVESVEPINVWRDASVNDCLTPPTRAIMPPKVDPDGRPDRTNAARKYSPIYTEAYRRRCGEESLGDPVH